MVKRFVDEIVTVDEEEIANAIMVLLEREKTLAEGAGAVALAALLQKKTSLQGERTAVLVCGGNIDVSLLARIIERGRSRTAGGFAFASILPIGRELFIT